MPIGYSTIGHFTVGGGSPITAAHTDVLSRVTLYPAFASKLLLVQGYEFQDLPDDAVISGIGITLPMRWLEYDDTLPASPHITFLSLHHPDLGLIENETPGIRVPGPTWEDVDVGGETDLWSEHWTPALLKRGEFGVGLIVYLPIEASADMDSATIHIKNPEIAVHYQQ
jgi:hypothetical protein